MRWEGRCGAYVGIWGLVGIIPSNPHKNTITKQDLKIVVSCTVFYANVVHFMRRLILVGGSCYRSIDIHSLEQLIVINKYSQNLSSSTVIVAVRPFTSDNNNGSASLIDRLSPLRAIAVYYVCRCRLAADLIE